MKNIFTKNISQINKGKNKMKQQQLQQIFNTLEVDRSEFSAKAYGLTYVNNELLANLILEDSDVYELIEELRTDRKEELTGLDFLSIITWGWAAPLNSNGEVEGAPSKHPDKRRVRLIISLDINSKESASVLQFQDSKDDLVFDYGSATGSLADALQEIVGQ
jgi:hypothetical protein